MTLGALPHTVEVRTLASRGVDIDGTLSLDRMPRLQGAIEGAPSPAKVKLCCSRDEEGRFILDIKATMLVSVTCQRCLDVMDITLGTQSLLAAVLTDEQAEKLPARYDPLLTEQETDLWQVVEDELLLALPAFSYHDDSSCGVERGVTSAEDNAAESAAAEAQKDNPFSVLVALKGSTDQKQ